MYQASPQSSIFLAIEPIDFRKGIDGIAGICRQKLEQEPLNGAFFVFRNRSGTMIRILAYDGQGFWLSTKRFSQGKIRWWPKNGPLRRQLSLREFQVLLWNGNPEKASFQDDWRSFHPVMRLAS
ncbi:IS66 family insertion sequence element accessory protein TnpB [Deltaproteobacteria bacterium TL4]